MSAEERFVEIVKNMDAEILEGKKRIAELESQLRIANYPIEQATVCGHCNTYKHTPWKDDQCGYVCASCLTSIYEARMQEMRKGIRESVSDIFRLHADLLFAATQAVNSGFSAVGANNLLSAVVLKQTPMLKELEAFLEKNDSVSGGSVQGKLTIEETLGAVASFYAEATRRYFAEQDRITKNPSNNLSGGS
jgi:hypothetical protein